MFVASLRGHWPVAARDVRRERFHCRVGELFGDFGVDVHRERDRGVAEHLGDDLGWLTRGVSRLLGGGKDC